MSKITNPHWSVYLLVTITSVAGASVSLVAATLSINANVIYTSILASILCFVCALILVSYRRSGLAVLVSLSSAPVLFGLVALYSVTSSFQMPAVTKAAESEFKALCKDVGVKLLEKPAATVRSIAYDFDPNRVYDWSGASRVEVNSSGHIRGFGGFGKPGSDESKKSASFEFTERRAGDGAGRATINPSAPYYRFPPVSSLQPYFGVAELGADVLAFLDVDKPDETGKAPIYQRAVRYQITLTDRRSGVILGVQTYVVDRLNSRACGMNVDNAISPAAFIFDAINR